MFNHIGNPDSQPKESPYRLSPTARVANWSARHRWLVVSVSLFLIVLAAFVLSSLEPKLYAGDGAEGEAARGADLIDDKFSVTSAPTEQLIFNNPSLDAADPAFQATVQSLVQQLRALPEVASVMSYYDTRDPSMVSGDRHVVLAQVIVNGGENEAKHKIDAILGVVRSAEAPGFEIVMAGATSIEEDVVKLMDKDFARILMITVVLALTILLIAFRSAVAAVVPLALAIGSILVANAVAVLISHAYPLADIYGEMILLMGMAVAVDYSLFIVSRFRSERRAGRSKLDSIAVACNTTGRAVFYAGVTVVLSLAGLMMTSNPIFISLAMGAIFVVLIAVLGSLTFLPALLSVLGDRVNWLRLPFIGREGSNNTGGIWGAITDKVLARPAILASITTAVLLAAAAPVVTLNLGFNSGSDALPKAVESRRGLELLETHFTAGLMAPAIVVVEADDVNSPEVQAALAKFLDLVSQDVRFFHPFDVRVSPGADLLYVTVPINGNIDDKTSETAVKHLRSDLVPQAFGDVVPVYVTGQTAGSLDFKNHMYGRAPYVFTFVLGLAFVLLLVMFRSIIIPLKAIALNLLSVGAAYGVLVMVFQKGWGIGLLGAEASGVIEAWLPLFLFGILFGLSMDYHMLLLNRIKEAHDQGRSNDESVSSGIKLTASQITSAAAIMVGVFGAFAMASNIGLKQFGVGLGVAVLVDATVIRSILLPASMKLLGDRNWYLPQWLEWLPRVSTEGAEPEAVQAQVFQPSFPAPQLDQAAMAQGDD